MSQILGLHGVEGLSLEMTTLALIIKVGYEKIVRNLEIGGNSKI